MNSNTLPLVDRDLGLRPYIGKNSLALPYFQLRSHGYPSLAAACQTGVPPGVEMKLHQEQKKWDAMKVNQEKLQQELKQLNHSVNHLNNEIKRVKNAFGSDAQRQLTLSSTLSMFAPPVNNIVSHYAQSDEADINNLLQEKNKAEQQIDAIRKIF